MSNQQLEIIKCGLVQLLQNNLITEKQLEEIMFILENRFDERNDIK